MKTNISTTLEKLFDGGSISNNELIEATDHFEKVVNILSGMGPVWRMPYQEALRTLHTLDGYMHARGLKVY